MKWATHSVLKMHFQKLSILDKLWASDLKNLKFVIVELPLKVINQLFIKDLIWQILNLFKDKSEKILLSY